ncbi:MAG: hypothetical protein ACRDIB_04270 [Ardenticatenaceae bacterium]
MERSATPGGRAFCEALVEWMHPIRVGSGTLGGCMRTVRGSATPGAPGTPGVRSWLVERLKRATPGYHRTTLGV